MASRYRLIALVLVLSLTGCATVTPLATECAPPPSPPAQVVERAKIEIDYWESVRPWLDWLNKLLRTEQP